MNVVPIDGELFSASSVLPKGGVSLRDLVIQFICPMSLQVMADPVICSDGYTYERKAIAVYLRSNDKSPVLGTLLNSKNLIPNITLSKLIRQFIPDVEKRSKILSNFLFIPSSVVSIIFSYLPAKTLSRICILSREFNYLGSNQNLWRRLLLVDFGVLDPGRSNTANMRVAYVNSYLKANPMKYVPENVSNVTPTGRGIILVSQ